MQVGSSVSNRYYTPYQTNKSVKYCAGFSQTEDGKLAPNETTENPGFAEFVDYQEFHKAWMSQGAETAFSYTQNNGFNADTNSISLVPGMSARLRNGFRLAIGDYMVQALGDFRDNQAASESAAIAGALSHLIKVANGQIPMNMFYSKNQDNSAYAKIGLQAFGIDTSRPFTINGRTFHFDGDEQIRLGGGQRADEKTANTDIDFSRFAPYAPEEVRTAFHEAAEETGYYEYSGKGKMNYISQILVRQVENRQNGVANYTDVFGGSVASALQAAREMLYDLENPLIPDNQRSEDVMKYREQEKGFYRAFIEKLEGFEDRFVSKSKDYYKQPGEVTKEFAGMSFWDLINSGKGNEIPVVNKIVNAKNPEDGKIYLTFFTEDRISCYEPGGKKVWDLEISNEEQVSHINKLFENYVPDRSYVKEYYSNESLGIVASKEFWERYFERDSSEKMHEQSQESVDEVTDYNEILKQKINEIFVKIQNGDTEPTYQIGSQSFTEKEWKEFLDKFDSAQEAIQELMKEEQARKEAEEAKKEDMFTNDAGTLLTTESTSCVYETADSEDDDLRYITWYAEEGIFCRKAGQTVDYEWAITFKNKEQYDKVMEFIGQFPSDWNMRFAAHENFWQDFLNDEIDMEGFMEFINGTNKGVPDYSITVGNSMYIDTDKMQWAKYTNPLEARFYTAEEMQAIVDEEVRSNQHKKKTLYEMLRDSTPEGTNAKYSFVGEEKIYSFYEFIDEIQRRSFGNNSEM